MLTAGSRRQISGNKTSSTRRIRLNHGSYIAILLTEEYTLDSILQLYDGSSNWTLLDEILPARQTTDTIRRRRKSRSITDPAKSVWGPKTIIWTVYYGYSMVIHLGDVDYAPIVAVRCHEWCSCRASRYKIARIAFSLKFNKRQLQRQCSSQIFAFQSLRTLVLDSLLSNIWILFAGKVQFMVLFTFSPE
jgi:hypothetical protein